MHIFLQSAKMEAREKMGGVIGWEGKERKPDISMRYSVEHACIMPRCCVCQFNLQLEGTKEGKKLQLKILACRNV